MNIGNHIIYGDITKISSDEIPNDADVIIGGFPCQGFSVANIKRSMEDKRNFLYKEMLRIIRDKKPKFFVAENVKGLLSIDKGAVINMVVQDFEDLGCNVSYKILNAAQYGVPQIRERVLIIGNRIGKENVYPLPTHYVEEKIKGTKPAITTQQTIGHLSTIRLSANPITLQDNTVLYNHIASTNVADTFFGQKYEVNQHDICDDLRFWRDKSGWTTSKVDKHFGYSYTAGHRFRKDNNSGSIPKLADWWELKKIGGLIINMTNKLQLW